MSALYSTERDVFFFRICAPLLRVWILDFVDVVFFAPDECASTRCGVDLCSSFWFSPEEANLDVIVDAVELTGSKMLLLRLGSQRRVATCHFNGP